MSEHRKALLSLVNSEPQQHVVNSAPKRFIADFELVADFYELKALGEYDAARNAARADLSNAITCYAALAEEIRGDK